MKDQLPSSSLIHQSHRLCREQRYGLPGTNPWKGTDPVPERLTYLTHDPSRNG
jgi:hypothetical protein